MRMLKRENCSYDDFKDMRQQILDTAPYGLINDIYDSKNNIAYLYFWDSDYIPKDWEQWVVRPISKKSKEPKVSEEHAPSQQMELKLRFNRDCVYWRCVYNVDNSCVHRLPIRRDNKPFPSDFAGCITYRRDKGL